MTITTAPARKPLLVGLSGRARHGKDTAASALVDHRGFTRYAFADRLKAYLYALDPVVYLDLADYSKAIRPAIAAGNSRAVRFQGLRVAPLSALVDDLGWEVAKEVRDVRRLLQRLGTEAGRAILGEDVWVDATFREISMARRSAHRTFPVVISDVRFPNEAEAVRASGGIVVRVHRQGYVESAVLPHPSETALDNYPFDVVISASSADDLQAQILDLV